MLVLRLALSTVRGFNVKLISFNSHSMLEGISCLVGNDLCKAENRNYTN